jgi:hypothetical protein
LSIKGEYRIIRPGSEVDKTVATLMKFGLVEALSL